MNMFYLTVSSSNKNLYYPYIGARLRGMRQPKGELHLPRQG